MTYTQALEKIHAPRKTLPRRDLSRIKAFMEFIGNPQDKLRFVHVAGTNGKGSTVSMIAAGLREAGYKTGMYISPFVYDFRERIQIDGEMISREKLSLAAERIFSEIESFKSKGGLELSEFEIVTAMAFSIFASEMCDYVCLETGVGGLTDVTNIIKAPAAAVLTSVSLDHTERLGGSVLSIARHKCGIIKPGCIAVSAYSQPCEVLEEIKRDCLTKAVNFILPDKDALTVLSSDMKGSIVDYKGLKLKIPLLGKHQIQNAVTAAETLLALKNSGAAIEDKDISEGIAGVKWPGRMEIIRQKPLCIIDGAHNEGAIAAFCGEIKGLKCIAITAMMRDKAYEKCMQILGQSVNTVLCINTGYDRCLESRLLYNEAVKYCNGAEDCGTLERAVLRAFELCPPDGIIAVCGSMYILNDAKRLIQKYHPENPGII